MREPPPGGTAPPFTPFFFADFTAPALSQVVARTLAALPPGECPVWAASNHDISRFPTRWCDGDERKARLALLILAMLPGTLMLYYGDEIAMLDVPVAPDLRRDQMTAGDAGRDHERRCDGMVRPRRASPRLGSGPGCLRRRQPQGGRPA